MRLLVLSGIAVLGVAALGAVGFLVIGCSLHRPAAQAEVNSDVAVPIAVTSTPPSQSDLTLMAVSSGPIEPVVESPAVVRVGGDARATIASVNGEFRSGDCRITTPLPEGYPPPTAPGAIEIKKYPVVRRAEIGGTISPDWGMNFAFFPLFNHIKRRDIAMTSPVEMNYEKLGEKGSQEPSAWTMSFVYRTTDLGPTGVDPKDDRILIEDIPPMTVLSVGMRGPYKLNRVNNGLETLRAWLSEHAEWEEAGEPRTLYYNGPEMGEQDKWSEVQLPVRRR